MRNIWLAIVCITITLVVSYNTIFKPTNVDNRKEVVIWTLQMGDFSEYMNGIISKYEKSHPDIKIKWVDVPFSEGEKRTLASILSNTPPDLINLNPDFSLSLAQKGALEFLDINQFSEYNPQIVNSLKYNNKLYGIPWYATSAVTIYNKKLYNQAKFNKFPKTYNDIFQMAKISKQNTGKYIFLPTITENDTMLKILNKYGITCENISTPKSIEIFEQFHNLYKNNLISAECISQTHREALEKYMSENIIFFQGGANFLSMIKDNAPNVYKETDVATQLVGDLGQYDFSLMNFIIPYKAKHKKEALEFGLYLTNAENQLALAKMTNVISTNNKALSDKFYNDTSDLVSKARMISAKQITKIEPMLKQYNNQKEINTLVNTAVQSILLNGDTKNTLNKLQKDCYR